MTYKKLAKLLEKNSQKLLKFVKIVPKGLVFWENIGYNNMSL